MSGYLTRKQIRDQVIAQLRDGASSTRQSKVNTWIDTEYHALTQRYFWPQLMRSSEQEFTLTVGQKLLYLPKDCEELAMIYVGNDRDVLFAETIKNLFRRGNVRVNESADTVRYAPIGELGRKADFSSTAEILTLTPSSVAAGNDFTVFVQGRSSDADLSETVSITGGVAADTTNSYTDLISVSVSGIVSGTLAVSGKTSTTEYATIEQNERTARYKVIRLLNPPDQADSYTLYYKRRARSLDTDDQVPEIPVGHVLVDKVLSVQFAHDRRFQDAASFHDQRAERALDRLLSRDDQGESVVQATPMMRKSDYRRIVVRN